VYPLAHLQEGRPHHVSQCGAARGPITSVVDAVQLPKGRQAAGKLAEQGPLAAGRYIARAMGASAPAPAQAQSQWRMAAAEAEAQADYALVHDSMGPDMPEEHRATTA
jgi:hypothetical protein